jgi:hypothetical protein
MSKKDEDEGPTHQVEKTALLDLQREVQGIVRNRRGLPTVTVRQDLQAMLSRLSTPTAYEITCWRQTWMDEWDARILREFLAMLNGYNLAMFKTFDEYPSGEVTVVPLTASHHDLGLHRYQHVGPAMGHCVEQKNAHFDAWERDTATYARWSEFPSQKTSVKRVARQLFREASERCNGFKGIKPARAAKKPTE